MDASHHNHHHAGVPLGVRALQKCASRAPMKQRMRRYQILAAVLTFFTYTTYHLSRKTISVVQSTLNPHVHYNGHGDIISAPGWAPFDDGPVVDGHHQDGKRYLGYLDTTFLTAYAVAMFFSGHVGDRSNLRYFLTLGMLGSGLLSAMLGMGYFWNIHYLWYFIFVQAVFGIYQASGWPSVVAVMGKWFPHGKRGLLMGIWNAHTSVGNILGALIPGAVLAWGWGWSFVVAGGIIALMGLIVALFLVVYPEDVGLPPIDDPSDDETLSLLHVNPESHKAPKHKAIKFTKALTIPGVIDFSLTLFFTKLVAYTFLYWLPYYVKHNKIAGKDLSAEQSAYISTLFDVGGILGGITAGFISDRIKMPALVTFGFLVLSVPVLLLYEKYGSYSYGVTVALLLVAGFFVNGPYALITTAVSADLGTHKSLKGNPLALATVTAIIDGTGSIGAALGPLLAGSMKMWKDVFYLLMGSLGLSAVCLAGVLFRELRALFVAGGKKRRK